jgi:hypothetical protein
VKKGLSRSGIYHIQIESQLKLNQQSIQRKSFTQLEFQGDDPDTGVLHYPGYPEIPVYRFYIYPKNIQNLRVEFTNPKRIRLQNKLAPVQESLLKVPGAVRTFSYNTRAYQSNQKFPKKSYYLQNAGSVKGIAQRLLTIAPVQYIPASDELIVYQGVKISYPLDQKISYLRNLTRSQKPGFAFFIGKKYAEHKLLNDYLAKLKTKYDVYSYVVKNSDTADTLRARIQKIYKSKGPSLRYALLIGDLEDVPSKKAQHITGYTDHYYRAIDTKNYESDINGPDIGVGRLSVSTDKELDVVIGKLIRYQKINQRLGWMKRFNQSIDISFLASRDNYKISEGTHNYVINNYTKKNGFSGVFPGNEAIGGDRFYTVTHKATGKMAMSHIRDGRYLVNYSGHGATTYWYKPNVTASMVRSMDDKGTLPWVISNSCITGQFNVKESFSETWLRHPYGAIGFWGSMDNTYWGEDDILEKRMYDGIFKDKLRTYSAITQNALKQHWKHYGGNGKSKYYWETYVLMGDPSTEFKFFDLSNN